MSSLSRENFQIRCANDSSFRADFLANPKAVLAQMGFIYPEATTIHIVESSPRNIGIILDTTIFCSEEELETIPFQLGEVVKRSLVDPRFKEHLLSNPVEAIFLVFGHRIPDDIKITVYEVSEGHAYFLVWRSETDDCGELSDLDLEQITGG